MSSIDEVLAKFDAVLSVRFLTRAEGGRKDAVNPPSGFFSCTLFGGNDNTGYDARIIFAGLHAELGETYKLPALFLCPELVIEQFPVGNRVSHSGRTQGHRTRRLPEPSARPRARERSGLTEHSRTQVNEHDAPSLCRARNTVSGAVTLGWRSGLHRGSLNPMKSKLGDGRGRDARGRRCWPDARPRFRSSRRGAMRPIRSARAWSCSCPRPFRRSRSDRPTPRAPAHGERPPTSCCKCGVPVPDPDIDLPCVTVNGIDWLRNAKPHNVFVFTTYGRNPAVAVTINSNNVKADGNQALTDLALAVGADPGEASLRRTDRNVWRMASRSTRRRRRPADPDGRRQPRRRSPSAPLRARARSARR